MAANENALEWESVASKTPFIEDLSSRKAVEFGVSS